MNTLISTHISHLNDLISGDPWLDESFQKKLEPVYDNNAFTRPLPELHSVAELISHMTEWKLSVISMLKGGHRTLTMASTRNWRTNDELAPIGWNALLQRFYDTHDELIALLRIIDDTYLTKPNPDEPGDYNHILTGIIDHDVYHLGQLGITIKYLKMR
jgi:uncharacterized damage-inducible protein DinB